MVSPDEVIESLIQRAVSDPGFWTRLQENPLETAREEGLDLEALRVAFQLPQSNDQHLVEQVMERVMRSRFLV